MQLVAPLAFLLQDGDVAAHEAQLQVYVLAAPVDLWLGEALRRCHIDQDTVTGVPD